ncbi:MAG: hypothetical protein NZ534_13405, partial [Bacteroidia bacterium]|nr:hypothetical protein [Bacteroidia bacterium]
VYPTQSTTYTLTVNTTGPGGAVCSATATYLLNADGLNIEVSVAPNPSCPNELVFLTAESSAEVVDYTWRGPMGVMGSEPTLIVNPFVTTTYTVTSTTPEGCPAYGEVTLTVRPFPTVTATAADPGLCIGESTVLTASGADTYEWFDASGNLLGTGTMLNVSPVAPSTTYRVVGTISAGCSDEGS